MKPRRGKGKGRAPARSDGRVFGGEPEVPRAPKRGGQADAPQARGSWARAADLAWPGVVLPKEAWVRTRVPLGAPGEPFSWSRAFGREAPRVLDLGCGNGYWMIHSGLARPEVDHLGVELVPPALRLGSLRAGQRGLSHVKFAWGDASEFVVSRCPPSSVDEVHLYHPQPYYDAQGHARRQLTPEVQGAIHRVLKPGGLFVFQTDNPAYMSYARRTLPALFEFCERFAPWPDLPAGRTLREIVARSQGLEIFRAESRPLSLSEALRESRVSALPSPDFDANKPAGRRPGKSARKT